MDYAWISMVLSKVAFQCAALLNQKATKLFVAEAHTKSDCRKLQVKQVEVGEYWRISCPVSTHEPTAQWL